MNWLGMILIGLGLIYLLYSFLNKSKINYNFKRYIKKDEMKIIKPNDFFRLQLWFSVFNSIFFIVCGIIIIEFNLNSIFILPALVPFHFVNLLLMIESKKRGYIDYKAYKTYN